jgi:hypothetical protein
MRILYRLLADTALALHLALVIFVMGGAFLSLRWPSVVYLHLGAVLWAFVVNVFGLTCPLTPLEKSLGARGGVDAYDGGCMQHYIGPLVHPRGSPRRVELVASVTVIAWNILTYTAIFVYTSRFT